ncbi:MAG: hypothetical protein WBD36_09090 [Bacteroidota bacterium]
MSLRKSFLYSIMAFCLVGIGYGQGTKDLKKYFNDMALRVDAASTPLEKREILTNSFSTMIQALDIVRQMPLIPQGDRKAISRFESSIRDKQNELLGLAGHTRVSDEQLSAFAHFTVQDTEQAEMITISLVTLLLIIIIVILLV